MDSFLINPKFDKKNFSKTCLTQWEIITLKNFKLIKRYLIAALIIVAIGFITGAMGVEYASFIIFIGIIVLMVVAALIMWRYQLKRRYKIKVKEGIKELEKEGITYTYEFSDNSVKYHDKEKDLELKWSAFEGYSIYKSNIVLLLNDSSTSFYIFGKADTTDTEYEKILESAKLKLPYKKIK